MTSRWVPAVLILLLLALSPLPVAAEPDVASSAIGSGFAPDLPLGPVVHEERAPLELTAPDVVEIPAGTTLVLQDGAPGRPAWATGVAIGQDGQAGQDLIINAPMIIFREPVRIIVGHGGAGGSATAVGDPDAVAIGGQGGRAGRIVFNGTVVGTPTIVPGNGGPGGDAYSYGAPGCDQDRDGSDASAPGTNATVGNAPDEESRAGDGACSKPGRDAGDGGNATAVGGNGGTGSTNGNGGDGGAARAYAGSGGHGLNACFDNRAAAESYGFNRTGNGGAGGRAVATGGNGGAGYVGGRGGDASSDATGGRGGDGTLQEAGKRLLDQVAFEILIAPGTGGGVRSGSMPTGGDGGFGVVGGAGGAATGTAQAGDHGNACIIPAFAGQSLPNHSIGLLTIAVMLGAIIRRGTAHHPKTPLYRT